LILLRSACHILGFAQTTDQGEQKDQPVAEVEELCESTISFHIASPSSQMMTYMRRDQQSITQRSLPPFHPQPHARSKSDKEDGEKMHKPQPWLMVIRSNGCKTIPR
jgi:hypothetical protein